MFSKLLSITMSVSEFFIVLNIHVLKVHFLKLSFLNPNIQPNVTECGETHWEQEKICSAATFVKLYSPQVPVSPTSVTFFSWASLP